MKIPSAALFSFPTGEPVRIAPMLDLEVSTRTYTPKAGDPESDWVTRVAFPAFGVLRRQFAGFDVRDFCAIGTGAGLDALAAIEMLAPDTVTVTDLDPGVVNLAVRNVRHNSRGVDVAGYAGSLGDALRDQERRFDLVYANLPNLPVPHGVAVHEGENSATFFADPGYDVPPDVAADLLTLQYACLQSLSSLLKPDGAVVCSVGARRPLARVAAMVRAAGFEPALLAFSWKVQSEASVITGGHEAAEAGGAGPFHFYDPETLRLTFSDYPGGVLSGDLRSATELETALAPFAMDSAEAATRVRRRMPVAHTTVALLARPR